MDRKVSRWLVSCYMCVDSLIWLIYLQIQVTLRSNRLFVIFQKKEMFGKRAKRKSEVSSHFSLYRNKSSLRKVLCIPSQACSRLKNHTKGWHVIRKISVLSLSTQRMYDCLESGREYQWHFPVSKAARIHIHHPTLLLWNMI